jgi:hypothetical protein
MLYLNQIRGVYGNRNTNVSHDKHDRFRRYGADENRHARERTIILSMRYNKKK